MKLYGKHFSSMDVNPGHNKVTHMIKTYSNTSSSGQVGRNIARFGQSSLNLANLGKRKSNTFFLRSVETFLVEFVLEHLNPGMPTFSTREKKRQIFMPIGNGIQGKEIV